MKIQAIALAVTTSLCAFGLNAAELAGKPYVVGSIGQAKIDLNDTEAYYQESADYLNSIPGVSASASIEDSDTSFSLGAGYWFNKHLAAEAFYRDYGTVSAGVNATNGVDSASEKNEFSASGLGVGILGFAPLSESFSLFARIDLVNLEAENTYSYSDSSGDSESGKVDDTNLKAGLGLGAQFSFNDTIAIRGDFQRIEAELEESKEDIDSFNFSILAMF